MTESTASTEPTEIPKRHPKYMERAKKIQKQLVIFFHAYKCHENDLLNEKAEKCKLKHCNTLKQIIQHLKICRVRACTVKNCHATRTILSHWNRCDGEGCMACGPLKVAQKRMLADANSGDIGSSLLGNMTFSANTAALCPDADPDMTISGNNETLNMDNTMESIADVADGTKKRNRLTETIDPWDSFISKMNELNAGMKYAEQVN